MKRALVVLLLLVVTETGLRAQVTTFILVRHGEKVADGSKDPELSEPGKTRALALSHLLKEQKIDAIYSTSYKRTQATIAPLAMSKALTVLPYDAMKGEAIDQIAAKYPGGTIVICGHSNTTPWTANYLLGKEQFKDFDDGDYDNVLIIDVIEKGKAKVTWLTY